MKAGTAQKAVLNMLSTAMMLRCGLVYRGLMVNMRVSNDKLLHRGRAMVAGIAGVETPVATDALDRAGLEIKLGVLLALGLDAATAQGLLDASDGNLRTALGTLPGAAAPACVTSSPRAPTIERRFISSSRATCAITLPRVASTLAAPSPPSAI